jgi:hypothetical protein
MEYYKIIGSPERYLGDEKLKLLQHVVWSLLLAYNALSVEALAARFKVSPPRDCTSPATVSIVSVSFPLLSLIASAGVRDHLPPEANSRGGVDIRSAGALQIACAERGGPLDLPLCSATYEVWPFTPSCRAAAVGGGGNLAFCTAPRQSKSPASCLHMLSARSPPICCASHRDFHDLARKCATDWF